MNKDDVLEDTLEMSGEVLRFLKDKGKTFAEMAMICTAASGTASAINTSQVIALSFANSFRKE